MILEIFQHGLLILDEVSDFNLGYKSYKHAVNEDIDDNKSQYRYFSIITFLAISANYLIAYSALIKIR